MKQGKILLLGSTRNDRKGEVCFYFFEKLKIFKKNKNKPLFSVAACAAKQSIQKSDFTPFHVYL
jgi:hypothetical protein